MSKKRCFVISPIGEEGSAVRGHADDVFRFIVEPAMEDFAIEAVRSDHIFEAGRISEQMFSEILQADLCVAVLTGHNPNVFYELAVAQCAARPVVLLIEKGQTLPFDVKDLRTVEYAIEPVSRLVDGTYAERVKEHVRGLETRSWTVPGLFEQYRFAPKLRNEQQVLRIVRKSHPEPLPTGCDTVYELPADPERQIALLTGDIALLGDLEADVVVSLEDTHLQPARFFETSVPGAISGTLRFMDAEKTPDGRVARDRLSEELREQIGKLGIALPVMPGTVVAAPTHGLRKMGVDYVFHVAALQGSVGDGYVMLDEVLDDCVRGAFNRFAELAPGSDLETILFPMLGAAASRLEPLEVARRLLKPILAKMKHTPACRKTYVLAWLEAHRHAFRMVAAEAGLSEAGARVAA